MHTDKAKERQGLIKVLGLAVAGATLLAGMVALPVTKASATPDPVTGFDTEDDFVPGVLNPRTVPKLTVTKYLSSRNGAGATGSAIDKPAAGVGTPAKGITFNVKEIEPATNKSVADMSLGDPSSFVYVDASNYFAGVTDGQGVISNWFKADGAGKPTNAAKEFPAGVHYYMMTENRSASPAFTDGTIDSARYQTSPDSMFSLPYKTTSPNGNTSGYIYNLHLYPKNVDSSSLSKVVTGTTSGGRPTSIPVPGDEISYKVTQKIFNAPANAGDGLLQIPEIVGAAAPHLRVVDRMSPSLRIDTGSINVKVTWPGSATGVALAQTADYTYATSASSPKRINSSHTADDVYPGAASGAEFHTFDFFNNPSTIANLVASGGAAEGVGVLDVEITYKAVVTAVGDNSSSGGLANDVRADNIDNPNGTLPGGHTTVPSGAAVFGKLKKANGGGYDPLQGAIFRLTDPTDSAKYLASDGNYYSDADTTRPAGVTFYEATSSASGVVAFTALPIMTGSSSTDVGKACDWNIVEYKSPTGYKPVSVAFSKVTYGTDVVGKTPSEIISALGTGPILPIGTELKFGAYAPPVGSGPATPITYNGRAVPAYMVNFASDDTGGDVPTSLPLTGGRGIILLLVVGVAIMGGALYVRSRRNATRA